jgi:diguanylate cyclase (GGDEF)-like protein
MFTLFFARLRHLRPAPFFVIPGLATELGQATTRLLWAPAFTAYLLLSDFQNSPEYAAAWLLTTGHFLFAIVTWAVVYSKAGSTSPRLLTSILVDQIFFAAALYLTDEIAAPFILMPILMTFSSGLRYGRAYAMFGQVLSSTLTCTALLYSAYWGQHSVIRNGLIVAVVLLPFYVFRLTDAISLKMRTDSLTRLRNRISFDELLEDTCHGATAAKRESAVVLLDLDGFKQINDAQGHDGGDLVLKHVAHCLSVELSSLGVPARFGGDEFAVIIDDLADRNELEATLTRFLKRTADVGQLFESPLGASIGVFYIEPGSAITPRFAFKAADQLMYLAKKSGKNQFVTSTKRVFAKTGELVGTAV